MANQGFEINYRGHGLGARKLLLEKGFCTAEELALMDAAAVEQAVNAEYEAFQSGEDWILVPRDRYDEFCEIAFWIGR